MATMRRFMPITTRLLQKISIKSRHFFTIRTLNDKKIYTESDEWLLKLDDYTHKLGISNFASEQLGDLV